MAVLQITGFSIDIGAVVVLSVCLGVAVDDTTHFVSHAKVLMAKGLSPVAVVQDTILKVGPAITLTTFILICAFGLFVTADFVPNANFGRMSIAILGSAWLIQFTLLPALLLLGKTQEQTGIITEQKTADETPGTVIQ